MVTFISKFILKLSDKTYEVRQLLKRNIVFKWYENYTRAVNKMKTDLSTLPVLQYFDPKLPVRVSVDASENG